MNRRELYIFLLLEIVAVIWAGLVFRLLDSRLLAGFLAGLYFVGSGLFMGWRILQWKDRQRSLTLYPLTIHLLVVSIPMMVMRFAQTQSAFEDIKIWGLPGPEFHRLSTTVFMLLIAATVADLIRTSRSKTA